MAQMRNAEVSCVELAQVLPLNVLVIAASGALGSTVAGLAIEANHNVYVFVRNETKLTLKISQKIHKKILNVFQGDATNLVAVQRAVGGMDVVIECLGNSQRAEAMPILIHAVEAAGCDSFIAMGSVAALLLPTRAPAGPALGLQPMADLHLHTLRLLRASTIKAWTQCCPSRLVPSHNNKPTGNFQTRADVVDVEVFRNKKDLTYEDVATAIVNACHLEASGFNGSQISFALRLETREGRVIL
mmetsp:Transcript_55841/g.111934  ORF Transcript_55841/g.111934 Transcript_55841/m.111934 type:complete len:244 (+) Transcript_55841:207-938(+)